MGASLLALAKSIYYTSASKSPLFYIPEGFPFGRSLPVWAILGIPPPGCVLRICPPLTSNGHQIFTKRLEKCCIAD